MAKYLIYFFIFFITILFVKIVWDETIIQIAFQSDVKFNQFKNVYMEVQNDQYEYPYDRKFGRGTIWVKQKIEENLNDMGMNVYSISRLNSVAKKTDIIVKCYFRYGWGIPKMARHFQIESRYRKIINLRFIDPTTNSEIIKIHYKRGFADSQTGDINRIFKELNKRIDEIDS